MFQYFGAVRGENAKEHADHFKGSIRGDAETRMTSIPVLVFDAYQLIRLGVKNPLERAKGKSPPPKSIMFIANTKTWPFNTRPVVGQYLPKA